MSHLDTAYKLGAMRAIQDFQTEVEKNAVSPLAASGLQASPAPNPSVRAQRALSTTQSSAPTALNISTRKPPASAMALGGKGPSGYAPGQRPVGQ